MKLTTSILWVKTLWLYHPLYRIVLFWNYEVRSLRCEREKKVYYKYDLMPQCHFDRIERDTHSDLQHRTNKLTIRHNKRLRAVHWDGSRGFGIGNGNQKAQIRNGYSGTTRKLKLDTIQRALNHGQISISITNLQRLWRADCIQTTPLVAALRMLQILWQTAP